MWILIFLFFCFTLLIFWVCFGYYIWLFLLGLIRDRKRKEPGEEEEELPFVTMVIPCLNEENLIVDKIGNLTSLDYPQDKMEVIFVDGGSEDRTVELINENKSSFIHLLSTDNKGKINQLNLAIKKAGGEYIIISDVDGIMSKNSIKEIVKKFREDERSWVVGIYSYPASKYLVDRHYWLNQNKARLLETKAVTSSIVIAQACAFRKELLTEFPQDVIADDIYVSFLANSLGYKTSYIDSAFVKERRYPKSTQEFIVHKFRKSNAYLREALRFLYMLPQMNNPWKIMLLTKLSQLLLLPWLLILWTIVGTSLASLQRGDIIFLAVMFLTISTYLTHRIFTYVKPAVKEEFVSSFKVEIKTFLLSNFILFINGLSFMFFKQTSNYKKVNSG